MSIAVTQNSRKERRGRYASVHDIFFLDTLIRAKDLASLKRARRPRFFVHDKEYEFNEVARYKRRAESKGTWPEGSIEGVKQPSHIRVVYPLAHESDQTHHAVYAADNLARAPCPASNNVDPSESTTSDSIDPERSQSLINETRIGNLNPPLFRPDEALVLRNPGGGTIDHARGADDHSCIVSDSAMVYTPRDSPKDATGAVSVEQFDGDQASAEVRKQYDGVTALFSPLVRHFDLEQYRNGHGNQTLASNCAKEVLTDDTASSLRGSVLNNSLRDLIERYRQDAEASIAPSGLRGNNPPATILQRHKSSAFDDGLENSDQGLRQRVRTIDAFEENLSTPTNASVEQHKRPRYTVIGNDIQPTAQEEAMHRRRLVGRKKARGVERTSTLDIVSNLGNLYRSQGKLAEAEAMYKRALAGREKVSGLGHMSTLDTINSLALLYRGQGKLAEAEVMYERAIAGYEKALGPEHMSTLSTVNNLGILYRYQGRLAEAEQMYKRALAGKEKALGAEHPATLATVNDLGILYSDQGRLAEAEQMYKRALAGKEKALGAEHPATLATVNNLGVLYRDQGRLAEAEQMYQRVLAGKEKALGPEHISTLDAVNDLGTIYDSQDRFAEAEAMYKRALAGKEKALGAEHPATLNIVDSLACLYCSQGKLAEAETTYERVLAGKEKALGAEHVDITCMA